MQHYEHVLKQAYEHVRSDRPGKALETFREASLLKPDEAEPLVQLALLFEHFEDVQGAIQLLEKAVSLDEQSAFAALKLGLFHYLEGDASQAAPHLRRGTQLIEASTSATRTLLAENGHEDGERIRASLRELEETAQLGRELLMEIETAEEAVSSPEEEESVGLGRMRIGLLTALWRRDDLSSVVLNRYETLRSELQSQIDLRLYAVGSEGVTSRTLAESNGFTYVDHPNRPLGAKWNAGLQAMRQDDLDAVVIVGSDDILNLKYFETQIELLRRGCVFTGLQDMYVLDIETLRLAYWPGYGDSSGRRGEPIGIGRCLHRTLLDQVDWRLWDDGVDSRLDRSAFLRLVPFLGDGSKTALVNCRREGIIALDVKSDENIWSMDDLLATLQTVEYLEAARFLETALSRSAARDLLRLSADARRIGRILDERDESIDQPTHQVSSAAVA